MLRINLRKIQPAFPEGGSFPFPKTLAKNLVKYKGKEELLEKIYF
jgi:hypothetical protein